ncbi:Cna B-type domain-containing protein [Listeria aquatica]|uniref:Cna B-type domain-containing protein n=2 Tax=Listeria aquatica TaxID=1494960 RepID=A0A841ZSC9_9LIST|nr:Cna B-type domain-containing protein [Listeria aquatica]MBC1522304.1 Cna B-type domain-containing protein [Listeria aquatica]
MKRKMNNWLLVFALLFGLVVNFATPASAAENLDASQFVKEVSLSNSSGPIGDKKISDASSVNATYDLTVGDGSQIDTSQPYTMPMPQELKYETSAPIELFTENGDRLGNVTIQSGTIAIHFDDNVKTMRNVEVFFNFWSNFNKGTLDYENGNDLAFPLQSNPNNTIHVNFSKSSSGGGSGTSAISKTLTYDRTDPTIVHWTVTVNNGGYEVADSVFKDTMENTQDYIPGSAKIQYRNWNKQVIEENTNDLSFTTNDDGTKSTQLDFGYLTSADAKEDAARTSVLIRYDTKLNYNEDNNRFPNRAFSYDGTKLIDSALSTASYRGQGGGGSGDGFIDVNGEKHWEDYNDKFGTRPKNITVELLRDNQVIDETNVVDNGTDDWDYSFVDLPEYKETGEKYVYTVREKSVPEGYTSDVEGTDITNRYENTEKTTLEGTIDWNDLGNELGIRPESVTIELLQNEQVYDEQVVNQDDQGLYKYSFDNLPKYDDDGEVYKYTVRLKNVPAGYTKVAGTSGMTYRLDDVTTGKALAKKQEAARDEAPKVTLTGSSDTAVLPPTGDDDAIPFGGLAGVGLLSLGAALLYGRKF